MLTRTPDLADLDARLRAFGDRAEIASLCDRYTRQLDRSRLDDSWFASVFTDDIELTFPMGSYSGMTGLAEFHEMARRTFAATFHIGGNYDIEVTGDRGAVHAHLIAVHVPRRAEPSRHFAIGGHYRAAVVRTADGWRINRFVFELVWNAGEPPAGGPKLSTVD